MRMRVPHGIRLDRPVTIDDGTDGGTTWDTWAALRTQKRERNPEELGFNAHPATVEVSFIVRYDPRLRPKMRIRDRSETTLKGRVIQTVEHVGRRRYTVLSTFMRY